MIYVSLAYVNRIYIQITWRINVTGEFSCNVYTKKNVNISSNFLLVFSCLTDTRRPSCPLTPSPLSLSLFLL